MTLLSDTQAKLTGPMRTCRQLTATTVCSAITAHLSKCTKQQRRTGCYQPYKASTPHYLCMAKQAAAKPTQCVLWYKQQRRTYSITSGTPQVQSCIPLPAPVSSQGASAPLQVVTTSVWHTWPYVSPYDCPVGREYTLRMSAIEIYNEKVRDLLKDGTERQNLPLLDDPERGTVAEGLSEEWPRSEQHLCQLLRQIEARRTVSLYSVA